MIAKDRETRMADNDIRDSVHDFIRAFIAEHGFSPTLREISAACYMSTTTVVRYLDLLCAAGRISRELQKPRSIALLDAPDGRHEQRPGGLTRH